MRTLWILIPLVCVTIVALAVCLNPERGVAHDYSKNLSQSSNSFVARLDSDDDGKVSAQEFDGPAEHFSHLDANNDGYLTEDEAPKHMGMDNGQGMGPGMEQGQDMRMGQGSQGRRPPGNPMEHLDKDGDNQVSRDEFPGPDDHFTRFDTNGDGYLSSDELPTRPPHRRPQQQ